jgi:hypothetical protein
MQNYNDEISHDEEMFVGKNGRPPSRKKNRTYRLLVKVTTATRNAAVRCLVAECSISAVDGLMKQRNGRCYAVRHTCPTSHRNSMSDTPCRLVRTP